GGVVVGWLHQGPRWCLVGRVGDNAPLPAPPLPMQRTATPQLLHPTQDCSCRSTRRRWTEAGRWARTKSQFLTDSLNLSGQHHGVPSGTLGAWAPYDYLSPCGLVLGRGRAKWNAGAGLDTPTAEATEPVALAGGQTGCVQQTTAHADRLNENQLCCRRKNTIISHIKF
ncbi:hypothetical protein AAFF_G00293060, partial [Aldrovandia affinis]